MSQSLLFFRAFQQPVGGGWQVCYCQRLWSQSLLFFRAFQLCKIHYDKVEECVAIPSFIQGISTAYISLYQHGIVYLVAIPSFFQGISTACSQTELERPLLVAIPSFFQGISTGNKDLGESRKEQEVAIPSFFQGISTNNRSL